MSPLALPASLMRGGTSKGLFVLAKDLPVDRARRDALLCAVMGSPDSRQIDGLGGGHSLTSKVAVVGPSTRSDADVEYLFLQVWPGRADVSDGQNCGNMLAAVGPFALEHGLVRAAAEITPVRILMQNTGQVAVAHVPTPNGQVSYAGATSIDGVPGKHAPIWIDFVDVAGSTCGALLPTGHTTDLINGISVTCLDNGMPVVCAVAADLGVQGSESPAELEADAALRARVSRLRLEAGRLMGLGDVTTATIPKVSLLSSPRDGGVISTRTFIPHRVHESIGVFGAVSVATACLMPGSVAAGIARLPANWAASECQLDVEHPTGRLTVNLEVRTEGAQVRVLRSGLLRTARLLMRGEAILPTDALDSVGGPVSR